MRLAEPCMSALLGMALATAATAQADAPALEGEALAERLSLLGQVQPRPASEIAANDWSVGAESMDRDYSTYASWRAYLGPLGAKRARVQSGWQRTDQGGGRYDFSWLDPIVQDMRAQGVQPWLSLSYGNTRYPGGGTERRDSPLPSGEGRKAWLAYVRAVALQYRDKVNEFEIWNEPDLNARIDAPTYAQFAFETARAIKSANPKSRIVLGAFAHSVWEDPKSSHGRDFARDALSRFVQLGGRGLASAVTYHAYHENPDRVYASLPSFLTLVRSIDPGMQVRQGENGAPSLNQQHYALRNLWWTEEGQAKWLLRRMLGDAGAGVPTSVFSITEMHYPVAAETNLTWVQGPGGGTRPAAASSKHFKGLLETRLYAPGTPEDDRTVVRAKMGYAAMQAVTSIFDSRLKPVPGACSAGAASGPVTVHAFRQDDGATVVAAWRSGDRPGLKPAHEAVDIICRGLSFSQPRYVDLLTRAAYETRKVVTATGDGVRITALPIYDSPVLIAEASLVRAR